MSEINSKDSSGGQLPEEKNASDILREGRNEMLKSVHVEELRKRIKELKKEIIGYEKEVQFVKNNFRNIGRIDISYSFPDKELGGLMRKWNRITGEIQDYLYAIDIDKVLEEKEGEMRKCMEEIQSMEDEIKGRILRSKKSKNIDES